MQKNVSIKCVQSATIIIHFIVMAKLILVYKDIFAVTANINLRLVRPAFRPNRNYSRCPLCGKATFLHHDYDFYSNIGAVIKNVITQCVSKPS